ncbi:MAG: adenylate/guanylate cyclase domain-containing protein [Acidimicrobiia bacterium]
MINCGNCGSENPEGHAFCSSCGHALARECSSCGTANDPSNRFCFNCGTALTAGAPTPAPSSPRVAPAADPVNDGGERRLVSVVFADLVGFTAFSEGRDPEDVRAMLTRYYERCREIIDQHGGTTDKFIGDAVMGVWGAVSAHEDDAERATRAALELVDMVAGLGSELGIPELAARAGVLSGEASVGSGGNAHGLVVGDLVNTASRLQSIAPPGGVFVGEATKELVGSAVEFKGVGEQHVKGKDIPVAVHEAVRVVALSSRRGGELSEGPFVGRDDELRILKDQLHATGREGKARMVSIVGEGGIGKTRLSQELLRYIDGISEDIYYHYGRSPSYGDGVTYWALGEMVRQRAGIVEGEESTKSRMKLRTMVADYAPDDDDQRWIEPRLAALIGLAPMPPGERSELFAALRAFFQAVSQRGTVLMAFEDFHWADEGLLDFVEELVERTTAHPIMVLCLTRPELLERRPDWAASQKRTLSMHLSRLDEDSMRALVAGLAPGIPPGLCDRIAARTAGVPLHGVEFVRMLLNAGQLVRDGAQYHFVGEDEQLAIPDTVAAIIGARLDRLQPDQVAVIQDAAVLGLSFTLGDLSGLRGADPVNLEPTLRELVRREILELDEDPRSPERGQYRFVQSLIREVAYSRLSRSERVTRHLEIAARFAALDDPELAGIVASHYADAAAADPTNVELTDKARRSLIAAAARAAALQSDRQAADLYAKAVDMATDDGEAMSLRLAIAEALEGADRPSESIAMAQEVLRWARSQSDRQLEIRAATALASVHNSNFEADKGVEVLLPLYEETEPRDDLTWARLAAQTSRGLMLANRPNESIVVADAAIPVMERLDLIEELLQTLVNKGSALGNAGRWLEGSAILRGTIELARAHDLTLVQARAINNLYSSTVNDVLYDPGLFAEFSAVVERSGSRAWTNRLWYNESEAMIDSGLLDEADAGIAKLRGEGLSELFVDAVDRVEAFVDLLRNGYDEATYERMMRILDKLAATDDPQLFVSAIDAKVRGLLAVEHYRDAAALALDHTDVDIAYPYVLEGGILSAAMARDDSALETLVDRVAEGFPRGRACRGLLALGTAYLAAIRGNEDEAIGAFGVADDLWSTVVWPYSLALSRAIFATTLGSRHPVALEAAHRARAFCEEHGLRLLLEGIISQLPDNEAEADLAV